MTFLTGVCSGVSWAGVLRFVETSYLTFIAIQLTGGQVMRDLLVRNRESKIYMYIYIYIYICMWYIIYLPRDAIVRLSHPRNKGSQGQKTFKPANIYVYVYILYTVFYLLLLYMEIFYSTSFYVYLFIAVILLLIVLLWFRYNVYIFC